MPVTTIPAHSSVPTTRAGQPAAFSTSTQELASDYQTPRGSSRDRAGPKYILTLRTDDIHHASMTKLRNTYFNPRLNKLDAHITLFHALPAQKLDTELIPAIQEIVSTTAPYKIRAKEPSRLKAGVSISVDDDIDFPDTGPRRRSMTRIIHAELRKKWHEWLSDQDSRPVRTHYTVMNKVQDNQIIDRAMSELEQTFDKGFDVSGGHFDYKEANGKSPDVSSSAEQKNKTGDGEKEEAEQLKFEGQVLGLTLWKYNDRGGTWSDPQEFEFQGTNRGRR